jgi:hypothetical protein
MAEDWELKSLERRIDTLEEKGRDAEERKRRRELWWVEKIWWTYIVALVTATITLVATGALHHH